MHWIVPLKLLSLVLSLLLIASNIPCVCFCFEFPHCFAFTGVVDPAFILEQIELQVAKVKEEAFSRKEILEKVEKWLSACDEECWLEEYNRVKCPNCLCVGL